MTIVRIGSWGSCGETRRGFQFEIELGVSGSPLRNERADEDLRLLKATLCGELEIENPQV